MYQNVYKQKKKEKQCLVPAPTEPLTAANQRCDYQRKNFREFCYKKKQTGTCQNKGLKKINFIAFRGLLNTPQTARIWTFDSKPENS